MGGLHGSYYLEGGMQRPKAGLLLGQPWLPSSFFKRGIQKMPTGVLTISQGQPYGN